MKILLLNPPQSGRSIPEEEFGIKYIKNIFRGEPLALEMLAGNLLEHDVRIVDLKAEPDSLDKHLRDFRPDCVGITALTCEANTAVKLAQQVKNTLQATVVVGGAHASSDMEFFNLESFDYIVSGLGKQSFNQLVTELEAGREPDIDGIAKTNPGFKLVTRPRNFGPDDVLDSHPPRYDLINHYRDHYTLETLGHQWAFVVTAYGCPYRCSFCCLKDLTSRRYLPQSRPAIIRDIQLLNDIPIIRLVDALTFGNTAEAMKLADDIENAGIKKSFIADVRADQVSRNPELFKRWKKAGLRYVVIGFEEIEDEGLIKLSKGCLAEHNRKAIEIIHDLGIGIIGDFIISPDYDDDKFDKLAAFITKNKIEVPVPTVLTPLPGTDIYARLEKDIINFNLDYYTLTNAVLKTKLDQKQFYNRYAEILTLSQARSQL